MHEAGPVFAALWAVLHVVAAGTREGPNFLILVADDMAAADTSAPLGASPARTPNLNAMAIAPGAAHFPRAYSGGPVCSPTRASILTGRTSTRDCIQNVEQTALPLQLQGATIADYASRANYSTAFFGKWHLGSNANLTTSATCYNPATTNGTCLPGYVSVPAAAPLNCCDGRDAHLPRRAPVDFGFKVAFGTSQVAPSSTSNCGCLETVLGAGVGCNLGHYAGAHHTPSWVSGLECDSTWHTLPNGTWVPYSEVTAVDDAAMLVDEFEAFLLGAVQADRPFLAQISFHQVHIPFIAPPEFRSHYSASFDPNHADYYGALEAMDAQVGRVRAMLSGLGLSNNTLVVFTADNGPECDNVGGHSTAALVNPGTTGGLQGRKRALLEGGILVPGIVEAPWLIGSSGPRVLPQYSLSTVDLLPTFLDLINASTSRPWPLDGTSFAPALRGTATTRPSSLGWIANFTLGSGNATCPSGPARLPPVAPVNFTTPADQAQVSWVDGPMKLIGCMNAQRNWHFRLFNVEKDRAEATDLFAAQITRVNAMFVDLADWLVSVQRSRDTETMCAQQQ